MDTVAIKQQLLSQYDTLQSRIKSLKEAAEKEVSLHASCDCDLLNFTVEHPTCMKIFVDYFV